jgi:hypothetical protein
MKNTLLLIFLLSCLTSFAQKSDKEKVKKYHLLPVYLVYTGNTDIAPDDIVREAFSRHNVKLISKETFDQLNEGEVARIATKFRAADTRFASEREVRENIAKEQRFVSNLLMLDFTPSASVDSLVIQSASWETTAYPPSISSAKSSGRIETDLKGETCCSVKDNIFALVDKILASKWLR